jgi:hypothetical protein
MDWFILLFLIPLILVPVVMLCGFAGCGLDAVGTGPALAPATDLVAKVTGTNSVDLTWKNPADPYGHTFSIERCKPGEVFAPLASAGSALSFTDSTATEATTYVYRVVEMKSPDLISNTATATTLPAKPTNLTATPLVDISVDPSVPAPPATKIELKWTNHSAHADGFILQYRAGTSGPFIDLPLSVIPAPGPSPATFTHTGLTPGQSYDYQVLAFTDGFDTNGNPLQVRSEPSVKVTATLPLSPVWKTILQVVIDQSAGSNPNDCIVQRLKGPFPFGGSKVRLTLRGPATGSIVIQRVYISPAATAGNEYDSGNPLTKVLDLPPVTLAANAQQLLGPVDFALDPAKDLIVAFDLAAPGSGRRGSRPGSAYYVHSNIDEAAKTVRTATGYVKNADLVYLLEKIEVLAPGP